MWLWERLQENYEVPVLVIVGMLCVWWYRKILKDNGADKGRQPANTDKGLCDTTKSKTERPKNSAPSGYVQDVTDCLNDKIAVSSLHAAVKVADIDAVQSFLDRGADPNATDRNFNTTYHILFQDISSIPIKNANEVLETLLKNADKHSPSCIDSLNKDGKTPLHLAVRNTIPSLVRTLLKSGANRSIPDADGNTPLHTIVEYMQFSEVPAEQEILDLLLQDWSSKNSDDDCAKKLSVNVLNKEQLTPLHQAVIFEEIENVRVLLEAGADPNIPDGDKNTPLHTLLMNINQEEDLSGQNRTLLTLLLGAKASVVLENKQGQSVLCMVTNQDIEEEILKT